MKKCASQKQSALQGDRSVRGLTVEPREKGCCKRTRKLTYELFGSAVSADMWTPSVKTLGVGKRNRNTKMKDNSYSMTEEFGLDMSSS